MEALPDSSAQTGEIEKPLHLGREIQLDQIVYCSLAAEPMDGQGLRALAASAALLNRLDNITGLLMYSDGVYVQLIEGPHQAVQNLWTRLLCDPRHKAVVQLSHYREMEIRACEDWHMELVSFSALQTIVHDARREIDAGRSSAWARAIEQMDFLLSSTHWDSFTQGLKRAS